MPETSAATDATQPHRVLTRSSTDRIVAGVAGGLANYFDIDPNIVRIAFVLSIVIGGAGVIAYIAAWLLVPLESGALAQDRMRASQ